jgi:hypothetical protein
MRKIQIVFLALTTVFATACPKPQYRPALNFDQGMVDKFNAALKRQYREYECYRFGPTHVDFQNVACTPYSQNLDNAKGVRNELIENALSYMDENYNSFVADLQAGRDRNNFLLDVVDLGTAAAVGITKGERTLQIIGVALTAFRGGRKSADANFYKDTSTPILISKMDGNRAKARAIIVEREGKPAADYTLGAAVSDIVDYYNAGTLVRAFTQLQKDTAIATEESEKALVKAKRDAGIRGAVPAATLAASNEFRAAILAHRTVFFAAKTNIATEEGKVNAANLAITNAGTAISQADQDIGAATAQVNSATTPTARAQADAAKARAEAAKAKAEKDKTQATADKQAAETAKAAAIKARDERLDKLRGIFDAIAAEAKLSPLLNKSIEDDQELTEGGKAQLRSMLARLRQKPTPTTDQEKEATLNDYVRVLLQFQGTIAESAGSDEELIKALREILNANK